MVFSDTTNKLGLVEQVRQLMRVDSSQWPTSRIVNSANNWLDYVAGYAIGADKRFQWDDTNHTHLPIGTTDLAANQSDYSFLTDEQGNRILTLTRIDVKDTNGIWTQLDTLDQADIGMAVDEAQRTAGYPLAYDKISDNIIRLYPKPLNNVTGGLKFYFQRSPSYFAATDTTKEPGVASTLHRGFVIASAYDGALTLGLQNLQPLSIERQYEEKKMQDYFINRNGDEQLKMRAVTRNTR